MIRVDFSCQISTREMISPTVAIDTQFHPSPSLLFMQHNLSLAFLPKETHKPKYPLSLSMAPMKPAAEEGQETPVSIVPATAPSANSTRLLSYILRLLAIVLTLVAAIVLGVAKQTVIIDVNADYSVEGKAKSTYNSSFVYFIIVNALACVYSAVSVGVSLINQNSSAVDLPLAVADLVVAVLLFTGNASAAAIEIVAQKGNTHFGWDKFCNYTDKFCAKVTASIVLSTVAAVVYALLLVLSMVALHKKSH